MGFHKDLFWVLFYTFFISDLPLYVNNVSTDIYADDTTLYDIHTSVEDIDNNNKPEVAKTWCINYWPKI